MKKRRISGIQGIVLILIACLIVLIVGSVTSTVNDPETTLRDVRAACERQGGQFIASFNVPSGTPRYETNNYCLYPRKEK